MSTYLGEGTLYFNGERYGRAENLRFESAAHALICAEENIRRHSEIQLKKANTMQRSNPFARAIGIFALIQAAAGDFAKMAAIPGYQSRGKGLGRHSGKKWGGRPSYRDMVRVDTGNRGFKWVQKENGARECNRRMGQIDRAESRKGVSRYYLPSAQAYAVSTECHYLTSLGGYARP